MGLKETCRKWLNRFPMMKMLWEKTPKRWLLNWEDRKGTYTTQTTGLNPYVIYVYLWEGITEAKNPWVRILRNLTFFVWVLACVLFFILLTLGLIVFHPLLEDKLWWKYVKSKGFWA